MDVNVHPSKLEVRFENEKEIYTFVVAVIKKSLGLFDLVPNMSFGNSPVQTEKLKQITFSKTEKDDFSDRPSFREKESSARTNFSDKEIDLLFSSLPDVGTHGKSETIDHPFQETRQREIVHTDAKYSRDLSEEFPFIIQLHNKYILSQIKTGLMIIDQHVAHERILYEKALKRLDADLPFSQQLLFPKTIELDPGRYQVLKEIDIFAQ